GELIVAVDVDVLFEGRHNTASASLGHASAAGHVGMEFQLSRSIKFRAGVDGSGLSGGLGLRIPGMNWFGTSVIPGLDYAFVNDKAFGALHRIGISLEF
ncbi:MAG: hypothetical protein FJY97_21505, partial [candidate division Zixibacteria bacterium]|nr:hypothetical protein [candidate division Zixibacteria bacterium]